MSRPTLVESPGGVTAGRDLLATVLLAVSSFAASAVLVRAFDGWQFVADALVVIVAGHGISFIARRLGVPVWTALPLLVATVVCVLAALHHGDTLWTILPTSDTWEAFRDEVAVVRDDFPTAVAPVEYAAGWAALAGLGVGLVVVLADTFAFAADARAESLVPGGVFFVFVSALGAGDGGLVLAGLFLASGILVTVALRRRQERGGPVVREAGQPGRSFVAPAALGVAVTIASLATVIGPGLPGASEPPIYQTKGRSGGVTEVVSPLVDIRSRLVDQRDVEVFRVVSTAESYWRVTTLPEFDGTTFRLPTRALQRVDGGLATARAGALEIRQEIEITALGGRLVPAAADPVSASGRDLRWNPDTSTLVTVGSNLETGDRFEVVSSSPRVQPSELRAAGAGVPVDPIYLALPDDLPALVAETAAAVTAGAPTAYDAALTLQAWFRDEFEYTLEVQRGHGNSAIEGFLERRRGYCEQFAATYAAMARTLGMPSRVAVGYTAGLPAPDGAYSVRGRNAHAWPELWFEGVGWVPFEPTPGRGAPGTEQYTNVAPAQDTTAPAPVEPEEGEGTEGDAREPGGPSDPSLIIPDFNDPSTGQGTDGGDQTTVTDEPRSRRGIVIAGLIVGLAALPALVRRVRRRIDAQAPPAVRVQRAWRSAVVAARRAGVQGADSMTSTEWAAATARALPVAARPMASLARAVDVVTFAPAGRIDLSETGPYGSSVVRDCGAWVHQIQGSARDRLTTGRRLALYFTDLR